MEFEEMNQRAFRREDTPDGLTPAERVTGMPIAYLYEQEMKEAEARAKAKADA